MTEARRKSIKKFIEVAYDRIEMKLPRGKKDIIKKHAEQYQLEIGEIGKEGYIPKGSMTGFISRAIDETIEHDIKNKK